MKTGYIFDFDGVLVNSLEVHWSSFLPACEQVGISVDKDRLIQYNGIPVIQQIELFAQHSNVQVDAVAVFNQYAVNYAQSSIENVTPIWSMIGIIQALSQALHPVAIASSGSREHIQAIVAKFDIPCDHIVSIDDVSNGKPDPEIFLLAAARLGVDPSNCVVIEDSEIGIEAAVRAGMSTLHFQQR